MPPNKNGRLQGGNVKIEKLNDEQLNYWVARAQGWHQEELPVTGVLAWFDERDRYKYTVADYAPVSEWRYGGPLIDIYSVYLGPSAHPEKGGHYAHVQSLRTRGAYGFDALQAVCRLIIRIAFGDAVPDQDTEYLT
jgi:hypothetical protein